jgi:hypothetical protein
MRSGVENLARNFAPLYLSSPTYNPTKKLFLSSLARCDYYTIIYRKVGNGERGFATAIIYAKVAQIGMIVRDNFIEVSKCHLKARGEFVKRRTFILRFKVV